LGQTYCETNCGSRPRKVNGLGNPMRICEYHYEELFKKGRAETRTITKKDPDFERRLYRIMTLAHTGLAMLRGRAVRR
jgi:hypothetical protein